MAEHTATLPTSSQRSGAPHQAGKLCRDRTRPALPGHSAGTSVAPELGGPFHTATGAKQCWLTAQVPQGVRVSCHQPPSRRWWHRGDPNCSTTLTPHLQQRVPALQDGLGSYLPSLCQQPTRCPLTNAIWKKGTAVSQRGVWEIAVSPPSKCGWGESQPLGWHRALLWHRQRSPSTRLCQEKPGGALKRVTVFLLCFCQSLKVIVFRCTSITGTTRLPP